MTVTTVSQLAAPLDWLFTAGFPAVLPFSFTGDELIASPAITLRKQNGETITVTPTVTYDTVTRAGSIALTDAQTTALNRSPSSKAFFRWSLSALVNGDGPYPLVARDVVVFPIGSARQADPTEQVLTIELGTVIELAVSMPAGGTWGTYVLSETGAPFVLESGDLLIAG